MKTPLKEQLRQRIDTTNGVLTANLSNSSNSIDTILKNQIVIMESLKELLSDDEDLFDVGIPTNYFPLHPNKQKP